MDKTPKYADVNPLSKLNPGEPWFFIRAQDKLSPAAVISYSQLLKKEANKALIRKEFDLADSLFEQSDDVLAFATKFMDWQEENQDLVKFPD
jgi:hypothetical protein